MSLGAFVARIGTSMQFVAFNAHWGVTYAVLHFGSRVASLWILIAVVLVAGALKEFILDARNETPQQSAKDNWQDWLGYATGCALAAVENWRS